jgi:hypothetical protein
VRTTSHFPYLSAITCRADLVRPYGIVKKASAMKRVSMGMKISDIVDFFRRFLGLRRPKKTGEGIPLEKQEIPEEQKTVEGKKHPLRKKGRPNRKREEKLGEKERQRRGELGDVIYRAISPV